MLLFTLVTFRLPALIPSVVILGPLALILTPLPLMVVVFVPSLNSALVNSFSSLANLMSTWLVPLTKVPILLSESLVLSAPPSSLIACPAERFTILEMPASSTTNLSRSFPAKPSVLSATKPTGRVCA